MQVQHKYDLKNNRIVQSMGFEDTAAFHHDLATIYAQLHILMEQLPPELISQVMDVSISLGHIVEIVHSAQQNKGIEITFDLLLVWIVPAVLLELKHDLKQLQKAKGHQLKQDIKNLRKAINVFLTKIGPAHNNEVNDLFMSYMTSHPGIRVVRCRIKSEEN